MKEVLEQTFDIPFKEESGYYPERWINISPYNPGNNLFEIKIVKRNNVRIVASFSPQRYSANLIHKMGYATQEKQDLFISNIRFISKQGAKIDIKINGIPYTFIKNEQWPVTWNTFNFKISKLETETDLSDSNICDKEMEYWGGLLMGTILSLVNIVPVDNSLENPNGYLEGNEKQYLVTRYERNPINRFLCLKYKGTICSICGINMAKVYGKIGENYIHIHHLIPVSQIGPNYEINPIDDLIPVCPNCHSMLHRRNPPYTPEELKSFLLSPPPLLK